MECKKDACIKKKEEKQNPWGIVILISLIVFFLSHLLNICLTRMSEHDETNLEYNRVGRNGRIITPSNNIKNYGQRSQRSSRKKTLNERLNSGDGELSSDNFSNISHYSQRQRLKKQMVTKEIKAEYRRLQ